MNEKSSLWRWLIVALQVFNHSIIFFRNQVCFGVSKSRGGRRDRKQYRNNMNNTQPDKRASETGCVVVALLLAFSCSFSLQLHSFSK